MEGICRICLDNSVTLVDIFAKRQSTTGYSASLVEMLNEFCEVNQSDMLPHNICISCVLAAQNAYKFKRLCQASQRRLRQMLDIMTSICDTETPINLNSVKDEHVDYSKANDVPNVTIKSNLPEISQENLTEDAVTLQRRYCEKEIKGTFRLQKHERGHTRKKNIFCPVCNKAFSHKSSLSLHEQTHSQDRPYKCRHCNKSFTVENYLIQHLKKLTVINQCCQYCSVFFQYKCTMRGHQKECVRGVCSSNDDIKENDLDNDKESNIAEKILANNKVQQLDEETYNLEVTAVDPPSVNNESLMDDEKECGFENIKVMFVCKICGEEFENRFTLKRHILHHLSEDNNLKEVDKNIREAEKDIEKVDISKKDREFDEKIACHFCKKEYNINNIKRHIRSHTAKRLFKCSICKFTHNEDYRLKLHYLKHHKISKINYGKISGLKRVIVRVQRLHLPKIVSEAQLTNKNFTTI